MNQSGDFFDGKLDLNRVGVMGFSLGGANAGQFCVTDSRCRAGIAVDGFMFGDMLNENLKVPIMFLHSDNPEVKPALAGALFYARAESAAYMVQINNTVHPDLGAPGPGGQPIILDLGIRIDQFPDGAYLAQIMNEYVMAFFDRHLIGKSAPLLDGSSPYPGVTFMEKDGN